MKLAFVVGFALALTGCKPGQVLSADTIGIDLTNAGCALAENQPIGQPGVDIVCIGLQALEGAVAGIATVLNDASSGQTASGAASTVQTVRIRNLPPDVANLIVAAHPMPVKKSPNPPPAASAH